jgi:hypothetical protein
MKKIVTFLFIVLMSVNCLAAGDDIKLFSLYPVPLKQNRLFVKLNYNTPTVSKVEVRNLLGKKIQEKQFPFGSDEIFFDEMDTNPDGVYIVLAKDTDGKVLEISKFIINK